VSESFFEPVGDGRWRATEHTVGPWDPKAQHGGPPSALLGRAIELCSPRDDMIVSRFTCEILGPVPVSEVDVEARVIRPGRSVELVEATLTGAGASRPAATARAWRVLRTDGPTVPADPGPVPDLPDQPMARTPMGWVDGYLSAVEWRPVSGEFGVPGPATVWARQRYPLIAGEDPTPLQRVLIVADSGNGLANELDIRKWQFICLAAWTTIYHGGAGLASSVLADTEGQIGTGAQALLVTAR
jgi:Thioesterase-like superfamily